ncbi:MAG: class I SAM-dependent methyltransferase [Nitrospirae bacterium]|nr:class I SAM-dependent methyltransferase [Candidatus Manganitrophaceae bacterium]
MSTPSIGSNPGAIDWNEMAKSFDRWLPYIQPVAEALIASADLSKGQQLLDVAAGTGEPSLTIARRFGPHLRITAIDGAEAMVGIAREKGQREGLSSVTFLQMKAEALGFETERFDRVISRFGVMLFDDPILGMKEMRRVLKTGGKMAIAVWGEFNQIRSIHLIWERILKRLPQDRRPPTPKMADLGPPGKLEALFQSAGFRDVRITPLRLEYTFDDFETYWKINTESGTLKAPLDQFSPIDQEKIKQETSLAISAYRKNGKIVIENRALLATTIK